MKYMTTRSDYPVLDGFEGLFNDFFGDWSRISRIPTVDVIEDEKKFTLEAELPGYTEDDLKISVQNHVLTLSSQKKSEDAKNGKYLIRERSYRSFERRFTLPEGIDEGAITAVFTNGVLAVSLPKLPVVQPRSIEVKIGK